MNKYEELKQRLLSQTLMTTSELDFALELVERATPKKVTYDKTVVALTECPNHKCVADIVPHFKHCPDCGQALDWSE